MEQKTILTAEEWLDIKAYGTYESTDIDNTEHWTFNNCEYLLQFRNLNLHEQEELLYAKKVI